MQRQGKKENSEFIFKDTQGKVIPDPRPYIEQNLGDPDYQATHEATGTHIAEIIGERPTQEDRAIVNQIPIMKDLNPEEVRFALHNTFLDLTQSISTKGITGGSTANITVLIGNSLYNANVGDSESFLFIRDKDKNVISFERLNKTIHDINHNNYLALQKAGMNILSQEIKENDGSIYHDHRLRSPFGTPGLNMYRAMGDMNYERVGLTHTPDICETKVVIPEGGDAFVLTSCDGLSEPFDDSDPERNEIKKLIDENKIIPLETWPLQLAVWAHGLGSMDNISTLITPVIPESPAKYQGVFDGHENSHISHFLSQNFHAKLVNHCEKLLLLKPLNEKQKHEYLGNLHEISTLKKEISALNSHANLISLYDKTHEATIKGLMEQKENENKAKFILERTDLLNQLSALIRDAFRLTHDANPGMPSSFSSRFAHYQINMTLKIAVTNLEAEAKSALIGFSLLKPHDKKENAQSIITQLQTAIATSHAMIEEGKLIQQYEDVNEFISKALSPLLNTKPFYVETGILSEMKGIEDKLTSKAPIEQINIDIKQFLFKLYMETYKHTQYPGLFNNRPVASNTLLQLEHILISRYPDIVHTTINSCFNPSLQNKILGYTGEHYPGLIIRTEAELLQWKSEHGNLNLFVSTAKLLARLGNDGFEKSSQLFTKQSNTPVDDTRIIEFYDKKFSPPRKMSGDKTTK